MRGFSLVEMLVALAVVAILGAVAVPSMRQLIQNNRAVAQANELVGTLSYARSEAVTRGLPVSVCASSNGSACTSASTWAGGWLVFTDGSGTPGTLDGTDGLLRVYPALSSGSSLAARLASGTAQSFLQYQASGFIAPTQNFVFELRVPQCQGDNNRNVTVTPQGRPGASKVSC